MRRKIHVWHLEIDRLETLDLGTGPRDYRLLEAVDPTPEFARYLYISVGASCLWYMRLDWDYERWRARFAGDDVRLWVAYDDALPIGFFELERQPRDNVEICYFGLIPEVIGQGHGKRLLNDAIIAAKTMDAKRVWLHTCTLDHPNALANYQARGFRVFREEDVMDDIPDGLIQPWPGANKPARN